MYDRNLHYFLTIKKNNIRFFYDFFLNLSLRARALFQRLLFYFFLVVYHEQNRITRITRGN